MPSAEQSVDTFLSNSRLPAQKSLKSLLPVSPQLERSPTLALPARPLPTCLTSPKPAQSPFFNQSQLSEDYSKHSIQQKQKMA